MVMDMWRPYQDAVRDALPGIPVVVDKFHVVKMANAALDALRKTVGGTFSPNKRRALMRNVTDRPNGATPDRLNGATWRV